MWMFIGQPSKRTIPVSLCGRYQHGRQETEHQSDLENSVERRWLDYIALDYDIYPHRLLLQIRMRPTAETSFLLTILVVAPPESVLGMDSSADVDLEGRFPAPFIVSVGFVCELSICMEIDPSPRFTRRVMSFRTVVLSRYGLEDPFSLPSAQFCHVFFFLKPFSTAPTLYHCPLKKKEKGLWRNPDLQRWTCLELFRQVPHPRKILLHLRIQGSSQLQGNQKAGREEHRDLTKLRVLKWSWKMYTLADGWQRWETCRNRGESGIMGILWIWILERSREWSNRWACCIQIECGETCGSRISENSRNPRAERRKLPHFYRSSTVVSFMDKVYSIAQKDLWSKTYGRNGRPRRGRVYLENVYEYHSSSSSPSWSGLWSEFTTC